MNNKILHWSYRDFKQIPINLLEFREICEEIYLKENFIETIPDWLLYEMENLKFLHLAGNEIRAIPADIISLRNLEFLDISDNLLTAVPAQIGCMRHLKRLNISGNNIADIPETIGGLENLEVFYANKNLLRCLPTELGRCKKLVDLSFDDNTELMEIPACLFALKNLQCFCSDRCNLYHLPYVKCVSLNHFRMCLNYSLTHIPYYYESFVTNEYAEKDLFHLTSPLIDETVNQVETAKEKRVIILPDQLRAINPNNLRVPRSLYEIAMGAAHKLLDYEVPDELLPPPMTQTLRKGPIGRCGGAFCDQLLFHECYLLLLRRNKRNDHVIITHLFCSKDCMDKWFEGKTSFYRKLEWKYFL